MLSVKERAAALFTHFEPFWPKNAVSCVKFDIFMLFTPGGMC